MKVLLAANKERGLRCLLSLSSAGYAMLGVVVHPKRNSSANGIANVAREMKIPVFDYSDINDEASIQQLAQLGPDIIVLAGYGQIVRERFLAVAPLGCINLHAGKLPQYRGSSPMNWALINGETSYTLSIIKVDSGVDSGNVLDERSFPIGLDDTIADLQAVADSAFPEMLISVLRNIENGKQIAKAQDSSKSRYYPLRFPDDGIILWDLLTAGQIHNRIRALTAPYPGAFTFLRGSRVHLWKSRLSKRHFLGEPGRIYECTPRGMLVCGSDRCLWIEEATLDGVDVRTHIARYDRFATLRDAIANSTTAKTG
jgi:methionyl-tRNA formyltransferase